MFPSIPNKQRQGICAMGAHLDLAVHNITEALKENGLWDDTLFIFANDNGRQTEENFHRNSISDCVQQADRRTATRSQIIITIHFEAARTPSGRAVCGVWPSFVDTASKR